jgi:CubicO group peptidase (beta-lactamase class C family)
VKRVVRKKDTGGMDAGRLKRLMEVVQQDIDADRYYGAVLAIGRHGKLALHEAIGHADPKRKRPLKKDSVFSLFSVTKAITVVLVLRAIERGYFALTTPIPDLVPGFSGQGREKITIFHLLTHSSGLPSVYSAREGMYIDVLDEVVAEICKNIYPMEPPGIHVRYAPIVHHALMGDALRRVDPKKRSYRQIVEEDLLKPLGMKDTSVGLRKDLRKRHLVPEFHGNCPTQHLGHSNLGVNGAFEEEFAEMPWVGIVSTGADMYRFAEMLRRGGELDGARILSPTMVQRAHHCWTGDKPNELYRKIFETRGWEVLPAYIGLGFTLRGDRMGHALFGTLTSPETFGNHGAGTTIFWVDPKLDMTFVGLSTGVMNSDVNIERWERLSDLAVAAAV